jgi:hypothetical protein
MEAAPRATRYFVPFRPKHGAALPTLKSSGRRQIAPAVMPAIDHRIGKGLERECSCLAMNVKQ